MANLRSWASALFVSVIVSSIGSAQVIARSTYLKSYFTPTAATTDSSGNVYLAGKAVLDPLTGQTGVLVAKIDPLVTKYLYLAYINGSVNETAQGVAVDSSGNVYVTGTTASANFPVTAGGALATPSTGTNDPRPFLTKLNPQGLIAYSAILGGAGYGSAVAIASDGGILVSGLSASPGFPATMGAYSVPNTTNRPFLMKVDTVGGKIVFSATGIGGGAVAVDSVGNIFVAGSTSNTDYPTTPGAYQMTFYTKYVCSFLCQLSFAGSNQYVTKVDPTGSKLIYSTT